MPQDATKFQPIAEEFIRSQSFALKVLNASLNGLYVYDVKLGKNIFINAQYTTLTGYTLYDLQAMDDSQFFSLFHSEDQQHVTDHMERIIHNSVDETEIVYRFKTKDGRWIWCLSHDSVLAYNEDGSVSQFIGTFFDMTTHKKIEEALRKSEKLYRELAANLPNGAAFVVDQELRFLVAEGQALNRAGMKSNDLEGKTIWEALDSELASHYEPYYRSALDGKSWQREHFSHGRHYATYGRPLRNTDGNIYAALAVSYDITERKKAEESVHKNKNRLELLATVAERLLRSEDPQAIIERSLQNGHETPGLSIIC